MTMPNKQLGSSIAWNLIWCRSLGNLSSHFVVVAHFGHGEILSHASTAASRKCNYEPNVHFILIKKFCVISKWLYLAWWCVIMRFIWCGLNDAQLFCYEKHTNQMMKRKRHIWITLGTLWVILWINLKLKKKFNNFLTFFDKCKI